MSTMPKIIQQILEKGIDKQRLIEVEEGYVQRNALVNVFYTAGCFDSHTDILKILFKNVKVANEVQQELGDVLLYITYSLRDALKAENYKEVALLLQILSSFENICIERYATLEALIAIEEYRKEQLKRFK